MHMFSAHDPPGTQAPALNMRVGIDLHVHTRRYSACAPSLNSGMVVNAINSGRLDGAVLTEHDVLWPKEEIKALNDKLKRGRIYRGVEVSSCSGHFVLIGIEKWSCLSPGAPIEAILPLAEAQAAAVIWAHPHQRYSQITHPLEAVFGEVFGEASGEGFREGRCPVRLDAIEVASTVTRDRHARHARHLARRHGLFMVGGSDAHTAAALGQVFTRFAHLPADERALAAAIRLGQCNPFVPKSPYPSIH
jgi:predicted metal-dependent phosphoesterase TrpH